MLVLALVFGNASFRSYGTPLAIAIAASLGAAYLFWNGRRQDAFYARAGIVVALLNVVQAILRLAFHFRLTDLLR